jgi:hypothetical protein
MATYVTTFNVAGGSLFPLDMLRYDECYPPRGDDAEQMARCLDHGISTRFGVIKLSHVGPKKDWQPTSARWASFGWAVDPESVVTIKIA